MNAEIVLLDLDPNTAELVRRALLFTIGGESGGADTESFDEAERAEMLAIAEELDVRRCRVCGCTDEWACDGGCEWADADLCSECVPIST